MELKEMENSTPGTDPVPTVDADDSASQLEQDRLSADMPQIDTSNPTPSTANDDSAEDTPTDVQNGDAAQADEPDEIAEWAKKQNIDLDNPTPEQARTLAKRLKDTQSAYHEANSKAKHVDTTPVSDLFKADPSDDEFDDPALKEVRETSAKVNGQLSALNFQQFVAQTPEVTNDIAGKMIEILNEEKETYGPEAARLLSNNHNRLFTLAKAASSEDNSAAVAQQAKQEERERIANAQQAAGPSSNAVSSAPQSNRVTDKDIANMSMDEYKEFRKNNNVWTL